MKEDLTDEMREEIKQIIEENNKVLIGAMNGMLMEFGNNQLKLMNQKFEDLDSKMNKIIDNFDTINKHLGIDGKSNTTAI